MDENKSPTPEEQQTSTFDSSVGEAAGKVEAQVDKLLNQAQDAVKNVNVNEEFKATESFMKDYIKNPVDTIVNEVNTGKGSIVMSIVLVAIWMAVAAFPAFINQFRLFWQARNLLRHVSFFSIFTVPFRAALGPLLGVAAISVIVFLFANVSKKSIADIVKLVVMSYIPSIVGSVIAVLSITGVQSWRVINPIAGFAGALSIILLFVTVKALNKDETNGKAFFTFAKVYGIYLVVRFIVAFFSIHI